MTCANDQSSGSSCCYFAQAFQRFSTLFESRPVILRKTESETLIASPQSAISKLESLLLIDLIIVTTAAGTHFYLQSQGGFAPKPASFTASDVLINTTEADLGEPITIELNITNTGETEGAYIANLTINNHFREN